MTALGSDQEALFKQIWDAYPRKEAERGARQVWAKMRPTPDLVAEWPPFSCSALEAVTILYPAPGPMA